MEEVEERDWLRVLALKPQYPRCVKLAAAAAAAAATAAASAAGVCSSGSLPMLRSLETVREEERTPPMCQERSLSLASLSDSDSNPDDVSPNGLQVINS